MKSGNLYLFLQNIVMYNVVIFTTTMFFGYFPMQGWNEITYFPPWHNSQCAHCTASFSRFWVCRKRHEFLLSVNLWKITSKGIFLSTKKWFSFLHFWIRADPTAQTAHCSLTVKIRLCKGSSVAKDLLYLNEGAAVRKKWVGSCGYYPPHTPSLH